MKINDTFHSFEALRNALDRYERENRVQFWKRDAKTIKSAENHAPGIYRKAMAYPALKYYHIKFACIHGGQAFRSKTSNAPNRRSHHGTWKQNCKAEILIGLTKDRKSLIVNNIVNEHNHDIPSEEVYNQLPKQRKIDKGDKMVLKKLKGEKKLKRVKEIKISRKSLEANLVGVKGNVLFLKDDIIKINTSSSKLEQIINVLQENYCCTVDTLTNENQEVVGLFCQDHHMTKSFELFPEVLFLDGTYTLLNIRCSVYVLCIENSFGITDVVGIGVMLTEDTVGWMVEKFKERNPKWKNIRVVITDKQTSDRKIVANHLPTAPNLICLIHAQRIFKKEIAMAKLNITFTKVQESLHFVNRLAEARSEEDYRNILEEMEESVPFAVMQYFYKNWHEVRTQWVRAFTIKTQAFFSFTNTRLESSNSRLKSLISTCPNFKIFVDKVFVVLNLKRTEFQNEFRKMILKAPKIVGQNRVHVAYYQYLTLFAFKKIESHLRKEKQYKFRKQDLDVKCETKTKTLMMSEISCTCNFFMSMKLPCRHLFSYRKFLDLNLFDERLCAERWTRKYVQSSFANSSSNDGLKEAITGLGDSMEEDVVMEEIATSEVSDLEDEVITIISEISPEMTENTSHDGLKEAQAVCSALARLCSEGPTTEFEKRINILTDLQLCWQDNKEVFLVCDVHPQLKNTDDIIVCEDQLKIVDHDYI